MHPTHPDPTGPPARDFEIRPVRSADLPALRGIIDASDLFPGELLDGMLADHLAGEPIEGFWLTLEDQTPQALAYCEPERMTEGTWNVLLIAVNPARQGQGLGGALLGHVEQRLAGQGARVLLVETSGAPDFERTRAFYDKHGYDEEARIRDFYAAGEDKVVFWKDLTRLGR